MEQHIQLEFEFTSIGAAQKYMLEQERDVKKYGETIYGPGPYRGTPSELFERYIDSGKAEQFRRNNHDRFFNGVVDKQGQLVLSYSSLENKVNKNG